MSQQEFPKVIEFPELASELHSMVRVDQGMREKAEADPDYWDDEVDQKNTERMKAIVAEFGWPTRSKVGDDGLENAWLLVQHADHDPDFQELCLRLISAEPAEEIDRNRVAYLTDRIRVNRKQSQVYGTQFTQPDDYTHVPRPIEDEAHVDERRAEMGLGTMEEGIKHMYEKYPLKHKNE